MVIESQLPDGKMVSLGIPVNDCYYTGTMMDGSGTVAISQCNNNTVKSLKINRDHPITLAIQLHTYMCYVHNRYNVIMHLCYSSYCYLQLGMHVDLCFLNM